MEAYGLKKDSDSFEIQAYHGYGYKKEGEYSIFFDHTAGLYEYFRIPMYKRIQFKIKNPSGYYMNGILMAFNEDIEGYGINAVNGENGIIVEYSVARDMLVVLAVMIDCYNNTGSTDGCMDHLLEAIGQKYDQYVID